MDVATQEISQGHDDASRSPSSNGVNGSDRRPMRVHARVVEALDVVSLDLRPLDGKAVDQFDAGSHLEIEVPGLVGQCLRHYSLCNDPAERHRYVIGVGRNAGGRGGSIALHDDVLEGAVLNVSKPRNQFRLIESSSSRSILVAGGIGITPLLAMARRLAALEHEWTFYYCVRTPAHAAFLASLMQLRGGSVVPIYSEIPGIGLLDVAQVFKRASPESHLYCCGPQALLQAFERAALDRDPRTVHVERFGPPAADIGDRLDASLPNTAFRLELARCRQTMTVPADRSVLEVLLDHDVPIAFSCQSGICGSCEVKVLEGVPDHHDFVLSPEQRAAGDRMLACVSRCQGDSLVLDL